MNSFEVIGGNELQGNITPQGAKNEALQILCAVVLTNEKIVLHNVPNIVDVRELIEVLKYLEVEVIQVTENSFSFCAATLQIQKIHTPQFYTLCSKLRGSVMLIGPLLAKYNQAVMPQPGGDKIGRRSISTHLVALQKLGVQCQYNTSLNYFEFTTNKLTGAYILLDEPSVTGTANIIMAAVLASGTTTIYNAACEPYLQQLCRMLNNMGASITGIGSNLLTINGVATLSGTTHTMLPDMIEVGSFIGLAAMTQSGITIKNAGVRYLELILEKFNMLGIELLIQGDDIIVPKQTLYTIPALYDGSVPTLYDHPWPGLTPDLLSILLVTAIHAKGSVMIHQKMFESRLFFVDKLKDMGAKIILCDPHRAVVIGLERTYNLRGITMSSPDIRAGVALLFAALSAKGKSIIHNINQIDRGYENIDRRLQALGANIKRVNL